MFPRKKWVEVRRYEGKTTTHSGDSHQYQIIELKDQFGNIKTETIG